MPGVLSDKRPTPCGDEPAAHGQQKLGKQTLGVVAKAAAAALLPYLASYIPTMGPYLSIPLSLPLWLPLSMGLGMLAFVGLYVCARMQTQIARAPSPYPFDYLDFTWEIMPGFFSISRKIDRPSAQMLDDLIQGPFCPHCHGLLQQGTPVDGEAVDAPRDSIAGHCQHCNWSHPELGANPDALRGITLHKVTSLVYREAQRQARARAFPQPRHKGRGQWLRFKRWLGSQ
jgi:hypothetical protein